MRGLVYLDQQVVGCYCPACEARVAAGHDRPLFSFTRFERHCGSKAKKWRLSLRIEPGTVKECPPGAAGGGGGGGGEGTPGQGCMPVSMGVLGGGGEWVCAVWLGQGGIGYPM